MVPRVRHGTNYRPGVDEKPEPLVGGMPVGNDNARILDEPAIGIPALPRGRQLDISHVREFSIVAMKTGSNSNDAKNI